MDLLRKLTTACAIVGAATFSGVVLTGCDEGYEAEEIEGLEGVGEQTEELGEGIGETGDELGDNLNNGVVE